MIELRTIYFKIYNMKKLLAIIILSSCFLTSSQADGIKDFEIEGVSIGDSLLSYVNKSEINNNLAKYYKDNEYSSFLIFKDKGTIELKDYDHMVLSFKTNDISDLKKKILVFFKKDLKINSSVKISHLKNYTEYKSNLEYLKTFNNIK